MAGDADQGRAELGAGRQGRGRGARPPRVSGQADAITAVEGHPGRRAVAFMSDDHMDSDLAGEVFNLEPEASDALDELEAILDEVRT